MLPSSALLPWPSAPFRCSRATSRRDRWPARMRAAARRRGACGPHVSPCNALSFAEARPMKYVATGPTSILLACALLALATGCGSAEQRKDRALEKGLAYLKSGALEKARIEFQNALQVAPKDAEARYQY